MSKNIKIPKEIILAQKLIWLTVATFFIITYSELSKASILDNYLGCLGVLVEDKNEGYKRRQGGGGRKNDFRQADGRLDDHMDQWPAF